MLKKWIVDEFGNNVYLIFDDGMISKSSTGRKFKFVNDETIYGIEMDHGCGEYLVTGEFTPHDHPFLH